MSVHNIPLALLTDSYKLSHPFLYPNARHMTAYGEFRTAFNKDKTDSRVLFYGMRYIIENYIDKRWTLEDVRKAHEFTKMHNAGGTEYPFPGHLFEKFIAENDGKFPIKIEALKEGQAVYSHVPVFQITAENEYSGLITYLETLLVMTWVLFALNHISVSLHSGYTVTQN